MSDDIVERITGYLAGGGLFNPELANHDAVRDLLIDARDALSARLAPVDDEAMVAIVLKEFIEATIDMPPRTTYTISKRSLDGARAAIAAIRPHIEAAEREWCAGIAEKYENEKANYLLDASARAVATLWRMEIAAAIRSGRSGK